MSPGNVEIVRSAYEAYARRDVQGLQALTDEDCVIHTVVEGRAEPQPFRGHDGIREWLANEDDVWASVSIEELEIRDLGDDRVFTTGRAFLRGRESGVELDLPLWSVLELREGRILSLRSFPERGAALEAAGLPAT